MFASAAVFASACTEEIAPVQEPDVTPVVLAENEMAARLPKMFDLGWSKGDKLTVISSSASQEFTILDDYAVSLAKFKGEALSGDSFTILKSDASTLADAEAKNYAVQEQAADGNVDHLDFDLALVGVSSYKDVTFSKEWAEENGGEFKICWIFSGVSLLLLVIFTHSLLASMKRVELSFLLFFNTIMQVAIVVPKKRLSGSWITQSI